MAGLANPGLANGFCGGPLAAMPPADRAMAETQRWRPTAQTFLRNIGEQLQALELDLAKLPKPTH